jgi:NitT/TauT family transport system permease protein
MTVATELSAEATEATPRETRRGPALVREVRFDKWREYSASLALFVILMFALEQLLPMLGIRPYILPQPSSVLSAFVNDVSNPAFWRHTQTTLTEIAFGWVLGSAFAFCLGVLLTQSSLAEAALTPYIIGLQSVPKIALAPIIVVWLGYGQLSKVAIAAIVAFFPVLINTMVGIRGADPQQLELMRALRATRLQTLRWVQLPGALPTIFGGLEVAVVLSVVGAIVGEFTGASQGLGYLIVQRNFSLDQAGVFSTLIMLSLIGLILDLLVRSVARYFVRWKQIEELTGA